MNTLSLLWRWFPWDKLPLLWRWSLRDARQRWVQVIGIAVILALGVAVYSGLGSMSVWRTESYDKSFEMLNASDIKLDLTPGSYLPKQALTQVIESVPHAEWIKDLDVRLILPTSVDASTADQTVLVSGRLIGMDVASDGPRVNDVHVKAGRELTAADDGAPVVIAEHNFATYYDLEPGQRQITVGGKTTLELVGNGLASEYFMVIDESAGIFGALAQSRFAALFVPLSTAQEIGGVPGMVNNVLLTVVDGVGETELDQLETELEAALGEAFPAVGISLEKLSENSLYRMMYDDIPNDQQMMDTFSFVLMAGAAFAAFILIGRIVEAQRREIGINMALGVPPMRIARRYLLIGLQIAFLGVALGAPLGLWFRAPIGDLMREFVPLPYFETPFQLGIFLQAALVGMLIPFLAIIQPIWRAVRVPPIDAIQTGYHISKGGGLAPLLARSPLAKLPGSSFTQMPLRNLSRGLRRTVLTVLSLSMAIILLILIVGMVDIFSLTLDAGQDESSKGAPNRMLVFLDDYYTDGPVSKVAEIAQATQVVPSVYVPGNALGDETIDLFIQLIDLDNDLWTPTLREGDYRPQGNGPGILLTDKAARDLGVGVGDDVTIKHLYRDEEARFAWRFKESQVQVSGIHADIVRMSAYMDIQDAELMNLEGLYNSFQINPAAGVDIEKLQWDLLRVEGVVAAQRAAGAMEAVSDMMEDFIGLFLFVQGVVLVVVFLIALNTTRSNIEERRRDLATMFAFGARVRTVLWMSMIENFIIGILGTLLGMSLGWMMLKAMMTARLETQMPDLSLVFGLTPLTWLLAVLFGVVVVALTPLFMARQLVKMDIPSTLRVME